jgi:hypothetical protein
MPIVMQLDGHRHNLHLLDSTVRLVHRQQSLMFASVFMTRFLDSPERWLKRAERARMTADHIDDPVSKGLLLRIAEDLERLAERLHTLRQERSASGK